MSDCKCKEGTVVVSQDCHNGYTLEIDSESQEITVWLGDECLAVFSVNYCPICGRSMDHPASIESNSTMKTVSLYTDGACSGNPGPGGWGSILFYNDRQLEMSGSCKSTTNNRMELTAVIKGLESLTERCVVHIYSDSKYVIDSLQKGWAEGWKKRGWRKADGKPALNSDLWEVLLNLINSHEVFYH